MEKIYKGIKFICNITNGCDYCKCYNKNIEFCKNNTVMKNLIDLHNSGQYEKDSLELFSCCIRCKKDTFLFKYKYQNSILEIITVKHLGCMNGIETYRIR